MMKTINKNIFFSLLFVAVLIGGTSCEDYLTVEPKSSWLTESFYESESDVKLGLAGMYSYLALDETYGQILSCKFEGGTDELLYNRNNTKWSQALYEHTAATIDIKSAWLHLYQGIDAANVFIEKVSNTTSIEEENKKQYLGEAHFLRALFYLDLVRWWGPVPLRTKPTISVEDNNLAASSREEVYAQIISDLEFAASNLQHAEDMDEKGHATKMAAHGILARTYLTMAGYPMYQTDKYTKVIEHCNVIIEDGWHTLNDSYKTVFLNYIQNKYDPKESIFELEFSNLRDQGIREDGRIGQINGVQFYYWPTKTEPFAYGMLQTGVKLLESYADEDERKSWNVANFICNSKGKISEISKDLSYWPGKFRRWEPLTFGNITDGTGTYTLLEDASTPDKNFTGINFPYLRYADVLLMRAEAENEVNGPVGAAPFLNEVRNRAKLGDIDMALVPDKASFLKEIQDERARELCYEGLRKQDLIRWNILKETLDTQNEMILSANDATKKKNIFKRAALNFEVEKHMILPYPLQEVTMNNKLEQHAEWQ
ncbi:RagB/SusD family nutrient uptake outer membrane protein [Carboxylicivirga sp. A043]|uniref:RagB/SusD family nutrient uptake outer membrane protein n=1 Tax=Carboxylicivirga litoralis TaxID=2816963 RepID=UPI0021CB5B9B|nr:RagB/SusD family nutrient uptake outer membrane protein [Carboxylicivirga sp. A043]MCU4157153.1 RagB/SusD family nutrient uptake outer membrane protein [Carboxylicivirga sp. A043]